MVQQVRKIALEEKSRMNYHKCYVSGLFWVCVVVEVLDWMRVDDTCVMLNWAPCLSPNQIVI